MSWSKCPSCPKFLNDMDKAMWLADGRIIAETFYGGIIRGRVVWYEGRGDSPDGNPSIGILPDCAEDDGDWYIYHIADFKWLKILDGENKGFFAKYDEAGIRKEDGEED